MWYLMENVQETYQLSERLICAISNWRTFPGSDNIEDLIESGADVNQQHGTLLPLHCACMVSDSYTVRLLLEKGARVNQVDGYGRMALHYAAERDVFCVEILLQYGADINVGDGNHDSPLHWAAYKDNVACVKLLLQHGAEVDVRDYNLDTPLSWAAKRGHLEVIKILLEYNADVHWKNLNGDTPLIRAATVHAMGLGTSLDDACLEILIRAAGQFELRDNDGALVRGIGQDNKMNDLLMPLCRNPRKLTDVCRCKIRTCLGHRYLPNVTPKLPIPLSLKEHILLQR